MPKFQAMIDELRSRKDSLDPPYPPFGAFVRNLLRHGATAAVLAKLVSGGKDRPGAEAINRWAADHTPSTNLHDDLREKLGYDIAERRFYECAKAINFPPPEASAEICSIRTNASLRQYFQGYVRAASQKNIGNFFDMAKPSTVAHFLEGNNWGVETLKQVLRKLPEFHQHASGEILSVYTPRHLLARVVTQCRFRQGLSRADCANRWKIDAEYLRYVETWAGQPSGRVYTKDTERLVKLCQALSEECQRLGINCLELFAPEAAVEERPSEKPVDEVRKAAPPEDQTDAGLAKKVERLEALVIGLQERLVTLQRTIARTDGALAPPSSVSLEDVRNVFLGAPYRSRFSRERWQRHNLKLDEPFFVQTLMLMRAVMENLGIIAGMADETQLAYLKERFAGDIWELFGALEAFSQRTSHDLMDLLEQRRKFAGTALGGAVKDKRRE
ncbi:hypothetical protein HY628_02125 [Candidatus Uhrbacteria bacterium]|nr:hypothetical protein [Candidatus Uhrbacteria bacterium]